jgi:long-chain-alcohol oxidase
VVSAAGALHTPALLLRSGVTVGGNVGANLRLHPATVVTAVFPKVLPTLMPQHSVDSICLQ